jgi:hypothetical protein
MAAATTSSPETSPQRPKGLLEVTMRLARSLVAGGDELEEQVGCLGLEGDVADFVDDEQRDAAELDQFILEPPGVVGVGELADPFGGGGESGAVPGLAGADAQADGQVGLAGAGRAEEYHVVAGGDEVQGAQVGDGLAFERAGVVEVEFLQALAGGEPGGADAAFAAVGFAGGDFALQAGGEEFLMRPAFGAGALGEAFHGSGQGRGFESAGEIGQFAGHVPAAGGVGWHQVAAPSAARPNTRS